VQALRAVGTSEAVECRAKASVTDRLAIGIAVVPGTRCASAPSCVELAV
jgi:hypothetical protein